MNQHLLDTLACPSCKRNLECIGFETQGADTAPAVSDQGDTEEVLSGVLRCGCGGLYPLMDGVPRLLEGGLRCFPTFIDLHREQLERAVPGQWFAAALTPNQTQDDYENIRKSFSEEWQIFDYDHDKTWGWTLAERKRVFLGDMHLEPQELIGKRLLDAGCGNGTMTAALSELGLDVVGLDLNDGLGLAYRNRARYSSRAREGVQYVQGNLTRPPLREESFDLVYSSGVIHHTPSSEDAFDSLVRMTRKGGRLYVWVYRKRALPIRLFFSSGRYLKRWLSFRELLNLCRLVAPLYQAAATTLNGLHIMPFRPRTVREITLDLFDAFAPRYNRWHTEAEVRSWFEAHGFQNICVSGRQKHGFGMYGDKPEA